MHGRDCQIHATKDIHIPISLLPRISMENTGSGYPSKHGYPNNIRTNIHASMDISMDIHGRGTDIHEFEYGSSDQGSFT